jgi:hypothetical protein
MTPSAWQEFYAARKAYASYTANLEASLPDLISCQQRLVDHREGASFTVETGVVYNRSLDEVGPEDDIRLILVADNPGRREQAAENRRYLVGPSGKLAAGFFLNHPELGIDFRRQVLILNKTPIHTPRTAELRELARLGGPGIAAAIYASQAAMAGLIRRFHQALGAIPLWIIGYSELGKGGLFEPFSRALRMEYPPGDALAENIFLFRHFSMNQFSADIRKKNQPGEVMAETLSRVGRAYRRRILGW